MNPYDLLHYLLFFTLSAFFFSCESHRLQEPIEKPISAITPSQVAFRDGSSMPLPFAGDEEAAWFILVRHAEKAYGDDPNLTPAGKQRAVLLAEVLRKLPLAAVYSSDFRRTVQTAEPVLASQGLELEYYETDELVAFYRTLFRRHRGKGEFALVAGHSNTTPELINRMLGEELLSDIQETDYDNIYVVAVSSGGDKEVLQLHFRPEPEMSP